MQNHEFWRLCSRSCTRYYLDDIIKLEDLNSDNILIDENLLESFLIYDISCKTLVEVKPLCIRFDKVCRFIRVYDGNRYLTLFGSEKYVIYNKIRYLISLKRYISYVFSHYYTKLKVNFPSKTY